jgi:hypothetical protein
MGFGVRLRGRAGRDGEGAMGPEEQPSESESWLDMQSVAVAESSKCLIVTREGGVTISEEGVGGVRASGFPP